jgi:hypothetical protein
MGNAQAKCNLELFHFGSSYKEIENQLGNVPKVSLSNKNRIFMPGEMVCENEEVFNWSPMYFIFSNSKLTEIHVTRYTLFGQEKPSLISWVESTYGEKTNKPKSFYSNKPSASWYWDGSNNSSVHYFIENDESGFRENIVIKSK